MLVGFSFFTGFICTPSVNRCTGGVVWWKGCGVGLVVMVVIRGCWLLWLEWLWESVGGVVTLFVVSGDDYKGNGQQLGDVGMIISLFILIKL